MKADEQAALVARVDQPRLPANPEPWMEPVAGTHHWILLDEISARCLAEGIVTGRVQAQARQVVNEKYPGEGGT